MQECTFYAIYSPVIYIVTQFGEDDEFKIHPMNFLNDRTLKGTVCGYYKQSTDLTNLVEMYIKEMAQNMFIFLS